MRCFTSLLKNILTLMFCCIASALIANADAQQTRLNILEKGPQKQSQKPLLILLSGPTDNWHSDSAWWILAQNYLAGYYDTVAIDRAGHAGTPFVENPSYQQFTQDLVKYIDSSERDIIILAFASSNLSVQPLLHQSKASKKIKGVVLIDPDVLTTHSIKHYSSDTEKYKKGWQQLEDYIASGKYDERIQQKISSERKHLKELIKPELEAFMDWSAYEAIETIRSTREYQIYKFKETTNYLSDLQNAKQYSFAKDMPLVVIDTDFESGYLATIKDEQVKASISQWRQEGIEWYFELAEHSDCGAYWPVASQEHLIMMENPELIKRSVERIISCHQ
ncbi:MAG: alpha/beta hydrolase [Kangiellaceae bacterium]|nr:alpha/beta hydrolase [Kangiellaceae bacterium]